MDRLRQPWDRRAHRADGRSFQRGQRAEFWLRPSRAELTDPFSGRTDTGTSSRNRELDSNGGLWVNNPRPTDMLAAIHYFDGESWQTFTVPDDIPYPDPWRALSSIHVDANNHVWVANTVMPGLAEYDGTGWTVHGDDVGRFKSIRAIWNGNIWLIEGSGAYTAWKFDGTNFVPFGGGTPPLSGTSLRGFGVDPATGEVYLGNWAGEIARTNDGGASWSYFGQVSTFVVGITFGPLSDEIRAASQGGVHKLSNDGTWLGGLNSYNTGFPWFGPRDGNGQGNSLMAPNSGRIEAMAMW